MLNLAVAIGPPPSLTLEVIRSSFELPSSVIHSASSLIDYSLPVPVPVPVSVSVPGSAYKCRRQDQLTNKELIALGLGRSKYSTVTYEYWYVWST